MAEILVKAVDATHPDQKLDAAGCFKSGDPVVAMPDGHEWGKAEGPPKFYVLKVPGLSVEDARAKYIRPVFSELDQKDPRARIVPLVRSALKFDEAMLAVAVEVKAGASIDIAQLDAAVVEKATGKTVAEIDAAIALDVDDVSDLNLKEDADSSNKNG